MILKQQQSPVYGNPDIWQVLLEYEHQGKQPALLTGYRIEWQAGVGAEKVVGKALPLEVVHFAADKRQVLDHLDEVIGRRCKCERSLRTGVPLQHRESVQVRAKFPYPLPQVTVVLF
jgi:hypothetical protein